MHNHGKCIAHIAVEQHIQFDQVALPVSRQLIVIAGIASAAALHLIEEIKDDFRKRNIVMQTDMLSLIDHILEFSAFSLADLHQRAHIFLRCMDTDADIRFFHIVNAGRTRQVAGVVDLLHRSIRLVNTIDYAGRCGDQIEIKFPFQPLLDDFHVQKSQETAAEAVSQSLTGFRIVGQGRIVELEFFEGILEVLILGTVCRINPAKDHGHNRTVTGQRFRRRIGIIRDGITHPGIMNVLDGRGDIADIPCLQLLQRFIIRRSGADFHHLKSGPGVHHPDRHAGPYRPGNNSHKADRTPVIVIERIENQCLKRCIRISLRCRHGPDNLLKDFINADPCLGGNQRRLICRKPDDLLNLASHLVRSCAGEINLVDDRQNLQIMLQCHIDVGQCLCLNALCGIHHKQCALTGSQCTADLIGKVHMAGGVNQVQHILFPVSGLVEHPHSLAFNGNPALPLQFHGVKNLLHHFPFLIYPGLFQQTVCQRGFPVVNMCNNTKIANLVHFLVCQSIRLLTG